MQLDDGIVTIFAKRDHAVGVGMPVIGYEPMLQGWYGKLEYATSDETPTPYREEVRRDMRIRILQDTRVTNHCCVVLDEVDTVPQGATVYEVTRAYHGRDDDSGELISDLTLVEVGP